MVRMRGGGKASRFRFNKKNYSEEKKGKKKKKKKYPDIFTEHIASRATDFINTFNRTLNCLHFTGINVCTRAFLFYSHAEYLMFDLPFLLI